MTSEDNYTDHESILLIRQEIQQLKNSQETFHKEMRTSFSDLKDNYAGRLNEHDKILTELIATRADFREKLNIMNQKILDTKVYDIAMTAVGILVLGLLIWHITGYHL